MRVSDGGGASVLTTDVALDITLTGENDQDPAFTDATPFTVTLPESTPTIITGTGLVFETAISDPDIINAANTHQTVKCSIAGKNIEH